jgi:hypothetical protein
LSILSWSKVIFFISFYSVFGFINVVEVLNDFSTGKIMISVSFHLAHDQNFLPRTNIANGCSYFVAIFFSICLSQIFVQILLTLIPLIPCTPARSDPHHPAVALSSERTNEVFANPTPPPPPPFWRVFFIVVDNNPLFAQTGALDCKTFYGRN